MSSPFFHWYNTESSPTHPPISVTPQKSESAAIPARLEPSPNPPAHNTVLDHSLPTLHSQDESQPMQEAVDILRPRPDPFTVHSSDPTLPPIPSGCPGHVDARVLVTCMLRARALFVPCLSVCPVPSKALQPTSCKSMVEVSAQATSLSVHAAHVSLRWPCSCS